MPYCPKCNFENTEEDTNCSNCNEPLKAPELSLFSSRPTYVSKASKYEDLKSSASAFFLVGGILLLYSCLSYLGILNIPFLNSTKLMLNTTIFIISIVFLIIAIKSYFTAKGMKELITKETNQTKTLIEWFITTYTPEELDQILEHDFKELTMEEMALKRMELIQDKLITHHDLPDENYIDNLCEQIYTKLYEDSNK